MANQLQTVTRFMDGSLAIFQNSACYGSTANNKFENFQNRTGSLGKTVDIRTPFRITSQPGLTVTSTNDIIERVQPMTVDQSRHSKLTVENFEELFNDYALNSDKLSDLREVTMDNLSSNVEQDLWKNVVKSTYRTHVFDANISYTQINQAINKYEQFSAPAGMLNTYLPKSVIATTIGNGLGQFTPERNNRDAQSWELGNHLGVNYYSSNQMETHIAGVAGQTPAGPNADLTFTAIDVTRTIVSFSNPQGDTVGFIKKGDILTFNRTINAGVSLNFDTFSAYHATTLAVQVRAEADADLVGNAINVTVFPALVIDPLSQEKNITRELVAAVDVATVVESHVAGAIIGAKANFVAFPRLPGLAPFPSVTTQDPDTGVSLRIRYGAESLNVPEVSTVIDLAWGSTLIEPYAMRLAFPLSLLNTL